MNRLIPALLLAVATMTTLPAEAQTLTRVNRSSVFTRAAANRSAADQRNKQRLRQRSQQNRSSSAKTRLVRKREKLMSPSRLGTRSQASVKTVVGTQREIAARKRRAQRRNLSKLPERGAQQVKVIKRRLATEAEARMYRPKRTVR